LRNATIASCLVDRSRRTTTETTSIPAAKTKVTTAASTAPVKPIHSKVKAVKSNGRNRADTRVSQPVQSPDPSNVTSSICLESFTISVVNLEYPGVVVSTLRSLFKGCTVKYHHATSAAVMHFEFNSHLATTEIESFLKEQETNAVGHSRQAVINRITDQKPRRNVQLGYLGSVA
jgi:hypothetical protein